VVTLSRIACTSHPVTDQLPSCLAGFNTTSSVGWTERMRRIDPVARRCGLIGFIELIDLLNWAVVDIRVRLWGECGGGRALGQMRQGASLATAITRQLGVRHRCHPSSWKPAHFQASCSGPGYAWQAQGGTRRILQIYDKSGYRRLSLRMDLLRPSIFDAHHLVCFEIGCRNPAAVLVIHFESWGSCQSGLGRF